MRTMMMTMAALIVGAPAMAEDRVIDIRQPDVVAAAVREAGYKAELKTDKDGEPLITSAANGSTFTIYFYGCTKGKDCGSLQFFSWYKADAIFTPAFINEWNATKRWIKIAIDKDGDLSMYMDVTSVGKTTYANFADAFDWYTVMDSEFSKFLAAKRDAAKPAK